VPPAIQEKVEEAIDLGTEGDLNGALTLMRAGGDAVIKEVLQTHAFFYPHGTALLKKAIEAGDQEMALKIVADSPWISAPMAHLVEQLPDVSAKANLAMAVIQHHPQTNIKLLTELIPDAMLGGDTAELVRLFSGNPRLAKIAFVHAWKESYSDLVRGLMPCIVKDATDARNVVLGIGSKQLADEVLQWANATGRTEIADEIEGLFEAIRSGPPSTGA
jgi:hypothetical protein